MTQINNSINPCFTGMGVVVDGRVLPDKDTVWPTDREEQEFMLYRQKVLKMSDVSPIKIKSKTF